MSDDPHHRLDPYPGLPPFVYAPVVETGDDQRLAMDTLGDGRTAVFVYSALDRLHEMYGAEQAWAVATGSTLLGAREQAPYDVLLLDTLRRVSAEPPTPPTPPTSRTRPAATAQPPGIFLAGSSPVTPTRGDQP